jgi:hypothetical protein
MDGTTAKFIYYGCTRSKDRNCKGGYIREEELISQFSGIIDNLDMNELGLRERIKDEVERYHKFQKVLGVDSEANPKLKEIDARTFAKYLLQEGSITEKRELLTNLKSRLILKNKQLILEN